MRTDLSTASLYPLTEQELEHLTIWFDARGTLAMTAGSGVPVEEIQLFSTIVRWLAEARRDSIYES